MAVRPELLGPLMRRPALIFDFGNVIAYFDFVRATTRLGAPLGLSGLELYERLGPLGFAGLLAEFERGRLTGREFSTRVASMIETTIDHDEFVAAWVDIFTPNESILPLIDALKAQGYSLFLGSNTNDLHATHFRVQFGSTLRSFDRLVLSHEVGHIKPSAQFFLACAAAASAAPEDCVFIDDLAENIAGARAAGLTGLVYQSTPQLIADLQALGIRTDLPLTDAKSSESSNV